MIKNNYFPPQAEDLLLVGNASICELSMGTDDVIVSSPIDWDWENA